MWSKHWDLAKALTHVRSRRIVAWPNQEFFDQLRIWDQCDCCIYLETGDAHPTYLQWVREARRIPAVSSLWDQMRPEPLTALEGMERPPIGAEDVWCSGVRELQTVHQS